jgi:hypothetical protein
VDGWFIFAAVILGCAVMLVVKRSLMWFALPAGAGLLAASLLLPGGGADNPLPPIGALLGVGLMLAGGAYVLVRLRHRKA